MKEKVNIPGPAKVMYAIYAGALAVVVYSGFNYLHPFVSGWRYPWSNSLLQTLNFLAVWTIALVSFVFLYYALLGKPKNVEWNERLGIFRIVLALIALWFFFLSMAVYQPYGWMGGLNAALGGTIKVNKWYEIWLWLILLVNLIYVYSRWAVSERFPRLTAPKKAE
ncbi:MAG TPA: hypothetical protein VIK22_07225 [Candidatus Anoxymicrobiaceae bacterium]